MTYVSMLYTKNKKRKKEREGEEGNGGKEGEREVGSGEGGERQEGRRRPLGASGVKQQTLTIHLKQKAHRKQINFTIYYS